MAGSERDEKENEKGVGEVGHGHPGLEPTVTPALNQSAVAPWRDRGIRADGERA